MQARMGSTRLPGKALLQLAGTPVIGHVMKALKSVEADVYAILCDEKSEPSFRDIVAGYGFNLVVGPEDDVLKRYCIAIERHNVDIVVRATGDNPLVSPKATRSIVDEFIKRKVDYARYEEIPLGTGVEVVRADALLTALEVSKDEYDHEHVTPYIYQNPDTFAISVVSPPPEWRSDIRVTLDTEEDFRSLTGLFKKKFRGVPVEIEDILGD